MDSSIEKCTCGKEGKYTHLSPPHMCDECYLKEVEDLKQYKLTKSDIRSQINKIDEFLFLGNEDTTLDKEILNEYNIKNILGVALFLVQKYPTEYNYLQFEVDDSPKQDLSKIFELSFKFIHKSRQQKQNIYVHCAVGVSRSASLLIAYLMMVNKQDFNKAFQFVKEKRPEISPNFGFIEQLKNWEKRLEQGDVGFKLD